MPARPTWAAPGQVALLVAAYLVIHLGVRAWIGPALGLDDAEQALFAQHWLPSYRLRAPPLFTWMLAAVSQVVNVGAMAIGLLRYLLLGMLLGFAYLTARRLIRDPALAALAVLSFAAIYVTGYYSHHDLTHTTAMSAFLAASWYAFVRLCETPTPGWYLALGLGLGLGMLGKWNLAIFAVALPLACLLQPAWRHLVLTWKVVPAALLAGMLVLPPALWALSAGPAEGDAMGDLLGGRTDALPLALVKGTASLALATLAFPQPFLVVFLLAFGAVAWRGLRESLSRPARGPQPAADARLIGTVIVVAIALHWLLVPLAGATQFQERLLQPALLILPVYLFMLVERGSGDLGPAPPAVRRYALALAGIAALALAVRIGIHVAGADHCRSACRDLLPAAAIAEELRKAGFSGTGTVVVRDVHLAGNLRVQLPGARVMEIGYPARAWPRATGAGQCLAVWTDRNGPVAGSRARIDSYLAGDLGVPAGSRPQREGTLTVPYPGSRNVYRLSYALYAAPQGDCR